MKQSNPLYIIVHESCVTEAPSKNNRCFKVEKELERIKSTERHIFIEDPLDEADKSMGSPTEELDVRVCGAYYGSPKWCVNRHLTALKKAGYKAKIHIPGSLIYSYNPSLKYDI